MCLRVCYEPACPRALIFRLRVLSAVVAESARQTLAGDGSGARTRAGVAAHTGDVIAH